MKWITKTYAHHSSLLVVIPKEITRELQISIGDHLVWEVERHPWGKAMKVRKLEDMLQERVLDKIPTEGEG